MSFGYLVHDFIDLVVNERSARIIELLFHHVVVLTGFMVTHLTEQFLYIVVIGLLMEVNRLICEGKFGLPFVNIFGGSCLNWCH